MIFIVEPEGHTTLSFFNKGTRIFWWWLEIHVILKYQNILKYIQTYIMMRGVHLNIFMLCGISIRGKLNFNKYSQNVSDETFDLHTELNYGGKKFPNFQQNLSAFVRGWQLVAVGGHPPTGVTWSRRVMWHQRQLVAIPWWRQRHSAENSGTFPP